MWGNIKILTDQGLHICVHVVDTFSDANANIRTYLAFNTNTLRSVQNWIRRQAHSPVLPAEVLGKPPVMRALGSERSPVAGLMPRTGP